MDRMLRNRKAIVFFVAPAFVLFTVVLLIPILQMLYYSLCDYNALKEPVFIGLDNFKTLLFEDKTMRMALKNSLFFMIFSAVTQQIIGVLLAVMLTNIRRGRNFFRNVIYLPTVLSSAALGLLWAFIFNMIVIAFVALWQYVGQNMMLYMAQIMGISKDLYEAARIDGASDTKTFRFITLPLIKPMFITSLSLNCIGSLKFFDLVYNMTQGGPSNRTQVLATHLYEQGFIYFKYGYSSAIAVVLLVLCLIVSLIIRKGIRVENYEM